MSPASPSGRRERNKAAKLERILAAAGELFAEHGVDDVTTQQIAQRADIGAGTLFLYARTKGELLLMVQNANYAQALERGRSAAEREGDRLEAVLAVLRPVVECNRAQLDNGRTYLREMVFGDASEPHHEQALSIVAQTEAAVADVLTRDGEVDQDAARVLAHVVSAVLFVAMAADAGPTWSPEEVVDHLRGQLVHVLPR
ncbi:TetR/AcrR family transcriptional regulator [Kineococcus sp. NPDC059986]|jgi:AcrR family transcriptional regulator|uniref:TetR/AcrR family transcriptional regulator n=1 Tax=Kineococcus sp. NPDC059986 TaxID=3155538 RepID=UPI00344BEA70